MRSFLDIDLNTLTIDRTELEGEAIARSGRYLIAKTLLDSGKATVNPLSPENPLMFSAGPFAGTNFSNANRTSVGCKSPLTGGIKEANTGGTFGFALGQLHLAGLTLHGACEDWTIIHVAKDGSIRFDSADGYLGMGNFETAAKLHQPGSAERGAFESMCRCSHRYHLESLGPTWPCFSKARTRSSAAPMTLAARPGRGSWSR